MGPVGVVPARAFLFPYVVLNGLPLAVELTQLVGEQGGVLPILGQDQSGGGARLAQATGGIEAGRQRKAHGGGRQPRRVDGGFAQHGREARPRLAYDLPQTQLYQVAVLVRQRHHVGNGADGHQVCVARQQIRIALTGAHQLHGHTHARQIRVGVGVAGALAVDEAADLRQGIGAAFVVVGDDHVHADPGGMGRLLHRGDAAVDGDDQAHALGLQRIEGAAVEAVALLIAVGNIVITGQTLPAQVVRQQTGGGDAVHVVVAVDRHGLLPLNGAPNARAGPVHAEDQHGVVQTLRPAFEQGMGLGVGLHPAQGEDLTQQGRQIGIQQFARNTGPGIGDAPVLLFHGMFTFILFNNL